MISRFSIYILLVVVTVTVLSCTRQDVPCLEPTQYFLRMKSVKAADTGSAGVDSTLPSVVVGYVDTPFVFYADTIKRNTFIGPLSVVGDSVRWFIAPDTTDPAGIDTITFHYERKTTFLSTACGYTYIYSLQNIESTNNRIDSIRIENTEVTKDPETLNVKVFY